MHSRTLIAVALTAFLLPFAAAADGIAFASLNGVNEVPSVINNSRGSFSAVLVGDEIQYKLSITNVDGITAQAHIHIGEQHTNGGVSAFLCDVTGTFPAAPPCPQGTGTVEGTITAATVIGPAGQGVAAGDFDALVQAIASRATYVNVHSSVFPNGAIRGQVRAIGF